MNTNVAADGQSGTGNGWFRSIGAAIAKRLAADGASVALTYSASPGKAMKSSARLKQRAGRRWRSSRRRRHEAVQLAVAKTIGTFGVMFW
jgi:NAD(P)-dependent dehydrogenase (short-subunit alcohol dehydrogenase family)